MCLRVQNADWRARVLGFFVWLNGEFFPPLPADIATALAPACAGHAECVVWIN
jgi:hypothetical protein